MLHLEFFAYNSGCTIQALSWKQNCQENFLSHNSTEDLKMPSIGNLKYHVNVIPTLMTWIKAIVKRQPRKHCKPQDPLMRHLWTKDLKRHGKTIQLYSAILGLNQEVQPKCRETPTRKKIYTSLDGAQQGDRAIRKKPEMSWVEVFLWFCTWRKKNQNNRSGRHQKSRNLFHCARKSQSCTKQQIPAWEANIDN